MNIRAGLGLTAAGVLLLTGCAVTPQYAIPVNATALTPSAKIGVVMTQLPDVNTSLPGAGCLLCLAAAEIANSSLTGYAKTLPYEGIDQLDVKMAEILKQRGLNAVVIPEHVDLGRLPKDRQGLGHAERNFKQFGAKYGVDKVLVIEVSGIGFLRTYNNYFPTSEPKGWVAGKGYVVDVATNALDWYLPIDVERASQGGWDEAPKYPGLTNAYFQAVELAKDSYLNPFRDPSLMTQPADAPPATQPVATAPVTAPATETAATTPPSAPAAAPSVAGASPSAPAAAPFAAATPAAAPEAAPTAAPADASAASGPSAH